MDTRLLLRLTPALLLVVALVWWLVQRPSSEPSHEVAPPPVETENAGPRYAGSQSCQECHAEAFEAWKRSHHGEAEMMFDAERHGRAFEPERTVKHGTQESIVRRRGGKFEIVTVGAEGAKVPFHPARIIGVAPLWQPLVAAPRGRYQATELAFDPSEDEWFNVYGDEDRRPDEWGFWANRGMTWNSMCASCHTTWLRKNWDERNDSYDTQYLELGVGCESCHGPYEAHVARMRSEDRRPDPAAAPARLVGWPPPSFGAGSEGQPLHPDGPVGAILEPGPLDRVNETCGACHARRVELTGDWHGAERFYDHYRPVIPDETDRYYPDGQVRDENFEYTSFLSSRMYEMGVRCIHCHEPHSGSLRAQGNSLCLGCHEGKIDPATHSRHDVGDEGGQCVNCHMPQTPYMQRHWRHDHGFTIPDPLLTREFGIPNACNRCHEDKDTEWAITESRRLWGDRLDRWTRQRTRLIGKARRRDADGARGLLTVLETDGSALWRSVALGLLGYWAPTSEDVRRVLLDSLDSIQPLERATAVRSLDEAGAETLAAPDLERVRKLLDDPFRMVRVEAAWTLRRQLDESARAAQELVGQLRQTSDQPSGALQRGVWHLDRQHLDPANVERAVSWMRRATEWDRNTAFLFQSLAIAESAAGRPQRSIDALRRAREIEPRNPAFPYSLALALAELEELDEAERLLREACELDPGFARAWYNLALSQSALDRPEDAIQSLRRAVAIEPESAEFHYALATIFERLERWREAVTSVEEAEAAVRRRLDAERGAPESTRRELAESLLGLIGYRASLAQRSGDADAIARAREDYERALRAVSGG